MQRRENCADRRRAVKAAFDGGVVDGAGLFSGDEGTEQAASRRRRFFVARAAGRHKNFVCRHSRVPRFLSQSGQFLRNARRDRYDQALGQNSAIRSAPSSTPCRRGGSITNPFLNAIYKKSALWGGFFERSIRAVLSRRWARRGAALSAIAAVRRRRPNTRRDGRSYRLKYGKRKPRGRTPRATIRALP